MCLALDGFLATAHPHSQPIGDPRPGAAEFTRRLSRVADVIIYTSRCHFVVDLDAPTDGQMSRVIDPVYGWCKRHGIWYDGIWVGRGKPGAALFVGPREVVTPMNPTHDDFVEVETTIKERLDHAE